jgi:hypothetical protein
VGAFSVVVQYMLDVVYGAERVYFVEVVLCKAGRWAIDVEGTSMFVVV